MPRIQESHPEPNERIIMPKFDSKAENVAFEVISGDYPFEIVAVDNSISKGDKTRGSDVREVKLKFYSDATFAKPLAQWTEDFINYETSQWKWSLLAKCVGFELTDGQEFDIDQAWIGRRGWASCSPHTPPTEAAKPVGERKKYNRVSAFLTNKGMLPPNPQVQHRAVEEKDDLPF
jgi:hypothetical protein